MDLYNVEMMVVLFGVGDIQFVYEVNLDGMLLFLLILDYYGCVVLCVFGDFGIFESEFVRYIGWDIGIVGVVDWLVMLFDVYLIVQCYLWFVIDCNWLFVVVGLIFVMLEVIVIFGNEGILE